MDRMESATPGARVRFRKRADPCASGIEARLETHPANPVHCMFLSQGGR